MKNLTKDIVEEVATGLIHKHDVTTTLDVKNELRGEGYWAVQQTVSEFMMELEDEGVYSFVDNGTHRIYDFLIEDDDDSAPVLTSDDAEQLDGQEIGCWITFSYSDPSTKIFVSGNVGRNVARHFAKTLLNETDYGNVAASKAK